MAPQAAQDKLSDAQTNAVNDGVNEITPNAVQFTQPVSFTQQPNQLAHPQRTIPAGELLTMTWSNQTTHGQTSQGLPTSFHTIPPNNQRQLDSTLYLNQTHFNHVK